MVGAMAADAVAMPVHWYYDRSAMDRDYGQIQDFVAPKNPHPDSILWRSRYQPRNKNGEILHDQAQYWGKRGVHYHQFLRAGESTINFRLGQELYALVLKDRRYDAGSWIRHYVDCLRTPGWHSDTYLEEYHREFFDNLARGVRVEDCGIEDIHIGGLTAVPFLLAALEAIGEADREDVMDRVRDHIALTHRSRVALQAAKAHAKILLLQASGTPLREAIEQIASPWASAEKFESWRDWDDRTVVGRHLSPACYLPESFTASLFISWRYAKDFEAGILANARCGGDNCHRGAVVGSLLGAENGVPDKWREGLLAFQEA